MHTCIYVRMYIHNASVHVHIVYIHWNVKNPTLGKGNQVLYAMYVYSVGCYKAL